MQKVLVIDDDRDMRLLLTRYLQKHEFEVIEAATGKAALEILEKKEPNVILCDFKLGDMTGNDLLARIKENYRSIPVIIITGYGDIKIAVEVMKLGAFDYVTKPLFPDEILLTIRKALQHNKQDGATTVTEASTALPGKRNKPTSYCQASTFSVIAPTSKTCWNKLTALRPPIIALSSTAKREAVRKPLHRKFTKEARERTNLSWR